MPVGWWWDGHCPWMPTQPEGDRLLDRAAHAATRWVARVDDREMEALSYQPTLSTGLRSEEGASPVRLCRKWQSPGRRPPGEDTRDYEPQPPRYGQSRWVRHRDLGPQIPSEVGWEEEMAPAGMGAGVGETLPGDTGQKNPLSPARGTAAPLLHPSQPHPARWAWA